MKDFFRKLRELWKTPKYHALLVLALWFLFFFICFFSLFIMNALKKPTILESTDSYTLDNYECNYQITINDKVYNLVGDRYKSKELVEVLNPVETFIITDHKKIDLLNGIDFTSLRLDYLDKLTSNESDKQTINYQNNASKTTYKIKGDILKIIDIPLNDEIVYLSIEKESNKIKEVVLDITSIMNKQDKKINNYKIVMTYSKYGQIKDFAID